MGGVLSTANSNDHLINALVEVDYIKTFPTEIAFRAVDRAEYFLPGHRRIAYNDTAWRSGHLHLSAPCIYSAALEGLSLKPGLSFLNLGSGTGYLNTVVGIILGSKGLNHGIEYHEDVIQYAYNKLEDFKKYSGAMDEFDFCEPVFARANCLCLTDTRLYDRVYCGASCPQEYLDYLKNLVKMTGGILVVPIGDQLMRYKRVSRNQWESESLLPVSFASLFTANETSQDLTRLLEIQPQSLQALVRNSIRSILRKNIERELPPIVRKPPVKKSPSCRKTFERGRIFRQLLLPNVDNPADNDLHARRRRLLLGDEGELFGNIFQTLRRSRKCLLEDDAPGLGGNQTEAGCSNRCVNERRPTCSQFQEEDSSNSSTEEDDGGVVSDVDSERYVIDLEEEMSENPNTITTSMVANDGSVCSTSSYEEPRRASNQNASCSAESSESEATTSNQSRNTYDRKKMDSGIGDENEILDVSDGENNERRNCSRTPLSSSDEERSRSAKRSSLQEDSRNIKYRRVSSVPDSITDSERNDVREVKDIELGIHMYESRYSIPMKKKIQELPLPQILKNYINYYRDF